MLDKRFLRAIYDDERDSYVVDELRKQNGEPTVEYRLTLLDDDGGIEKFWWDEHGEFNSEFFAFGTFSTVADFEICKQNLMIEARRKAHAENLDEFLSLLDLVKRRAVECAFAEEALLEYEGLFELGFEDAYILREIDPDHLRLHQRVERPDDECWRLHVKRVVGEHDEQLGWAVIVVHYPELTSDSVDDEVNAAQSAYLLDLDHFRQEMDARLAIGFIRRFMLFGDRVNDPDYAYDNDTDVFTYIAVGSGFGHEDDVDGSPIWEPLSGEVLRTIGDEKVPLVRAADSWRARESDMLSDFLQAVPQSPGMDDQLRAALMDMLGIQDEFDENSPWSAFDFDDNSPAAK